jgi:hypothetical protein
MINTLKRAIARGALLVTAFFATAALAQAPSEAQRAAIKSQCRSDYMAHCSSIPPGGELPCNACRRTCRAFRRLRERRACRRTAAAPKAESAPARRGAAPATPKTETVPAAATAKPAAEPAAPKAAASAPAKQPSSAQTSAIRSACRTDYPKICAGVPTGGAPALQCLEKNKAKLSAACATAVGVASGSAPTAGAVPATATAAPAAAAPAIMILRPMRPRAELFVLRSACGADVRSICGGVAPGGGRIVQCLATNAASLSPTCKEVLGQFAAQ